jgi:hypothetical protein
LPLKRSGDYGHAGAVQPVAIQRLPAIGAGRRILVAEGNTTSQIVIEAMLKKEDFAV